ncbi:hypothetical protein D3C80_967150 [compost metagenome]
MIKTIQNTSKYNLDTFDLHFFFDEKTPKSEGKLYNDNGQTPNAFEKGEYEILNFTNNSNDKTVSLTIQTETGKSFQSKDKEILLILHNLNDKIKKVTVDGKSTTFTNKGKTIEIPVVSKKGLTTTILIQL